MVNVPPVYVDPCIVIVTSIDHHSGQGNLTVCQIDWVQDIAIFITMISRDIAAAIYGIEWLEDFLSSSAEINLYRFRCVLSLEGSTDQLVSKFEAHVYDGLIVFS
jgi:hypothetical protein